MRTNDLPFLEDSSDIPVAAGNQTRGHSVPGDGRLRITWDAGAPQLVLAGDIDLTTHAALTAALAVTADDTGQVHLDLTGVNFCDVAGLRIIRYGGDGQQPAPAQVTLHNLPPHLDKLHRLLNRDTALDPVNDTAGHVGTSHPDRVARPRDDDCSAQTAVSTLNESAASPPPAAGAGQERFPGQERQAVPASAVPGSRRGTRSHRGCADA